MKNHAFLLFAHEDLRTVGEFRGEMEDRYPELSLVDHPVTQPFGNGFSAYIRGQIAQAIQTAPMTICFISERTASSPWVGWAIDKAHSFGKDILGVRLQSDATKDVPPAGLVTAGARIVDRDIDEVLALIFESSVAASGDRSRGGPAGRSESITEQSRAHYGESNLEERRP